MQAVIQQYSSAGQNKSKTPKSKQSQSIPFAEEIKPPKTISGKKIRNSKELKKPCYNGYII